tara:strand:+ start:1552 stop:1734 length:183 start_codon:yes stop_codon:yes gene_type:complete
MSPEELLRFAKYRRRLQKQNSRRPAANRMTEEQIQQKARKAAKSGLLNEHGIPSVKREDI